MGYLIYSIIPLAVVIGLISLIARSVRKVAKGKKDSERNEFSLAMSQDDALRQVFFLLSVLFLGVTIFSLNKNFVNQFSLTTILLITSSVALFFSYYFKVIYTLVFGMVGIMVWLPWEIGKSVTEGSPSMAVLILGLISLVYYTIGRLHKSKRYGIVYILPSLVTILIILFTFSSHFGLNLFEKEIIGKDVLKYWQVSISFMALLIILFGTSLYGLFKKALTFTELFGVGLITLLFSSIPMIPSQKLFISTRGYSSSSLTEAGLIWMSMFNILIFAMMLSLMFLGYKRRETWMVNLGAVTLFIFIFVKYFDWLFDSLDKSIFFIVGGILLFVVGWFMEKGRRNMLNEIKEEKIPVINQTYQ